MRQQQCASRIASVRSHAACVPHLLCLQNQHGVGCNSIVLNICSAYDDRYATGHQRLRKFFRHVIILLHGMQAHQCFPEGLVAPYVDTARAHLQKLCDREHSQGQQHRQLSEASVVKSSSGMWGALHPAFPAHLCRLLKAGPMHVCKGTGKGISRQKPSCQTLSQAAQLHLRVLEGQSEAVAG